MLKFPYTVKTKEIVIAVLGHDLTRKLEVYCEVSYPLPWQ